MNWQEKIRTVPNFPKKGILFYDITPVLQDPKALKQIVQQMSAPFKNQKIDFVAGIESRGFIFGSLLAQELNAGFATRFWRLQPIMTVGKQAGNQ